MKGQIRSLAVLGIDGGVHFWDNGRTVPAPPAPHFLPFHWHPASPDNEPLSTVYHLLLREPTRPHRFIFDQDSGVECGFLREPGAQYRQCRGECVRAGHSSRRASDHPGTSPVDKGRGTGQRHRERHVAAGLHRDDERAVHQQDLLRHLHHSRSTSGSGLYGSTRVSAATARHGARTYLHGVVLGHDSKLCSTTDACAALRRQIWLWQRWFRVFDTQCVRNTDNLTLCGMEALRVSVGPCAPGRFFDMIAEVFR